MLSKSAADGLYSVMVNIEKVEPRELRTVTASANDIEQQIVEWLNALLSLSDIERLVLSPEKAILAFLSEQWFFS